MFSRWPALCAAALLIGLAGCGEADKMDTAGRVVSDYAFQEKGGGQYSYSNPVYALSGEISGTRLDIGEANRAGSRASLELTGLRVAGTELTAGLAEATAPAVATEEGLLVPVAEDVAISYSNTQEGLRQNFVVSELPEGGHEAEVALRIRVETEFQGHLLDSTGVLFVNPADEREFFTYKDLYTYDAEGRELASAMTLSYDAHEKGIAYIDIRADLRGAVLPVTIDPLIAANWVLSEVLDSFKLQYNVAGGCDVNNDGYDDVIIGVPNDMGTDTLAGTVRVYLGSATGLSATPQIVIQGSQIAESLGISLDCAGDINGDGYGDIVVGSLYDTNYDTSMGGHTLDPNNTDRDEGAAFIFYGSMAGISASGADTIVGSLDTMRLGAAVAGVGDVNGDGYDDILLGAYSYSSGFPNQGMVQLHLGTASGIDLTAAWTYAGQGAGELVGAAVSGAGDVNGDGVDDLLVGAYGVPDNGDPRVGEAYMFLGVNSGLPTAAPNWQAGGEHANSRFGVSVSAAGDVNGDGYGDVVIGADGFSSNYSDTTQGAARGKIYVYHGGASGLSFNPNYEYEGGINPSNFGRSVSDAGDVNGDGYDDIIVGAPSYFRFDGVNNNDGTMSEGAAHGFYGSAGGLTQEDWFISGKKDLLLFGHDLSGAGDINGDGIGDVIVGTHGMFESFVSEGVVFAFHGNDPCGLAMFDDDPVFTFVQPDTVVFNDPNACGAEVDYALPSFDDNCPGVALQLIAGQAPGGFFPVGTTTVTYRITNSRGNTRDTSFTITVNDEQAPAPPLECSEVEFVDAMGGTSAVISYAEPVFTDNCSVVVTRESGPANGTTQNLGVYDIVFKGEDPAGNESFCTKRVIILDAANPAETCIPQVLTQSQRIASEFIEANSYFESRRTLSNSLFNGSNIGASLLFTILEGALGVNIPDWVEKLLGVGGFGIDLVFARINFGITPGINADYGIYNDIIAADSATVDVNYPVNMCMTLPEPRFYGCRDTITMSSSTEILPGVDFAVDPGVLRQEIGFFLEDLRVEFSLSISASACIGIPNPTPIGPSCIGYRVSWSDSWNLFPPITIWEGGSFPVIVTCDKLFQANASYASLVDCSADLGLSNLLLDIIDALGTGLSIDGVDYDAPTDVVTIGLPQQLSNISPFPIPEFDFSYGRLDARDLGPVSIVNNKLVITGRERTFSKFRFDIFSLADIAIEVITGGVEDLPPCVSLGTTIDIGCGAIVLDIGDLNASMRNELVGTFEFDPTFTIEAMDLNIPTWWQVIETGATGNSQIIPNIQVGHSVRMVVPDGVNYDVDMANLYRVDAATNIRTNKDLKLDFGIKLFQLTGSLLGGNTFSLLCLDPLVTVPASSTPIQDFSVQNTFTGIEGEFIMMPDDIPPVVFCFDTTVYLNDDGWAFLHAESVFDSINSYDLPIGGSGMLNIIDVYPDTIVCDDYPETYGYLVIEDDNCNFDTCQFTVTVLDTLRPRMGCVDIVVGIGENGTYEMNPDEIAIGITDNCRNLEVIAEPGSFDCDDVGIPQLVTITAMDIAGNMNSCEVNVTVVDTFPLLLECHYLPNYPVYRNTEPGLCVYFADDDEFRPTLVAPDCYTVITYELTGATTGAGNSNVGGVAFNLGRTTITYTATDASGNMTSCSFDVIVEDHEPPMIVCIPDMTISTDYDAQGDYNCQTEFAWDHPRPTDNCSTIKSYTVTYHTPEDSVYTYDLLPRLLANDLAETRIFDIGRTQVVYVVTDTMDNESTCSFEIKVDDDEAPMIFCEAVMSCNDFVRENIPIRPGDSTVVAFELPYDIAVEDMSLALAGSTSDFGAWRGILESPSGTRVQLFTNICAGDGSFDFVLLDTAATGIAAACGSLALGMDLAPEGALAAFDGEMTAGTWRLVIESDDEELCGSLDRAVLRLCGNRQALTGITHLALIAPDDACEYLVTDSILDVPFFDNCSGAVIEHDFLTGPFDHTMQGARLPVGLNLVNWVATDSMGNVSECAIIYEVIDTTKPVFVNCPAPDVVQDAEAGLCDAYVNFSLPVAFDNCQGQVAVDQVDLTGLSSGSRFPVGLTILCYEATDASGNTAACSVRVVVNDTQAGELVCPDDLSLQNDPWLCSAVVRGIDPVVDDNCADNVSVSYGIEYPAGSGTIVAGGVRTASGNRFDHGESTVHYRMADQPLLLITELALAADSPNGGGHPAGLTRYTTDDYVEITNLGPAALDASGLLIERFGPGVAELFELPKGTILQPGEPLVLHFGNGLDDAAAGLYNLPCAADLDGDAQAAVAIFFKDRLIDLVAANGYNPAGQSSRILIGGDAWAGALASGNLIRRYSYDTDAATDWLTAESCYPLSLGVLNPDMEAYAWNGATTALQSIPANGSECSFAVTIEDVEQPACFAHEADYSFPGAALGGDFSSCNEAVVTLPDLGGCLVLAVQLEMQATIFGADSAFVVLVAPDGTEVVLYDGDCTGEPDQNTALNLLWTDSSSRTAATDLCGTTSWTGEARGLGALHDFYAKKAAGDWTLRVGGIDGSDSRVDVSSWTLHLSCMTEFDMGDVVLGNDPGECGADFVWRHPYFADNCEVESASVRFVTQDAACTPTPQVVLLPGGQRAEAFFCVGTTEVIYTVVDANGNEAICSFNVIVEDREAPTFADCGSDITVSLDPGLCGIFYYRTYETDDNCEVEGVTVIPPNGSYLPIGDTVICVIARDIYGNEDTCKYTLHVEEYIPASNTMVCNDQVTVSLPADCLYEINADVMLEGNDYRCYENYILEVEELPFLTAHGTTLTIDDIGKCFNIRVIDPGSGNSCWGQLCVEDKQLPQVDCPADTTLACNDRIHPDFTGYPVVLSCEQSVSINYVDDFIDNDDCDDIRYEIVRYWTIVDESGNQTDCVQHLYVRGFDLADVEFPRHFDDLDLPSLACDAQRDDSKVYAPHIVDAPDCVDGYLLDSAHYLATDERRPMVLGWNYLTSGENEGHPSPFPVYYGEHPQWAQRGLCWGPLENVLWSGTGTPTINGESVYTNTAYCSLSVRYDDEVYEICGNSYEILRYWKIRDMCSPVVPGSNPVEFIQVIKITDKEGPEIVYPDQVTVGMDPWQCYGTWHVPAPWIVDNCQDSVRYLVQPRKGRAEQQPDGSWIVRGLPAGTTTANIIAIDECHRRSVKTVQLNVVDDVPPIAVCESHTTVSIPGGQDPVTASALMDAVSLDDGSFDNCNDVWFKAVRMDLGACDERNGDDDPVLGGYQEYPDDQVLFCCDDIGQTVMVRLLVFDVDPGAGPVNENLLRPNRPLFGRYTECMVEVQVQSKQQPRVVAPPTIVVSCDYWFDVNALTDPNDATFGRVVTSESLREKVKTQDIVCPEWCEPNFKFNYFPPAGMEAVCALYDAVHPERVYEHLWGLDGVVEASCGVQPTIIVNDQRECGQGRITRTISVPGHNGPVTATQTIFFVDCNPYYITDDNCFDFDPDDGVVWPCDADLSDCNASIDPNVTGRPVISNEDNCSLVAVKYDDEIFDVVPNACFKVLRTWTILDWCQYDPSISLTDGRWTYQQTILVNDGTPPVLMSCADLTFCDPAAAFDPIAGACVGEAVLVLDSVMDCSPEETLVFEYKIDLDNDGAYDITVSEYGQTGGSNSFATEPDNARDASGKYPLGTHKILWSVEDACGNLATCTYLFTIEDCKAPTPYCRLGIITTVMPSVGEIELWAEDYNIGSSDNCPGSLSFYFDSLAMNAARTFDCSELGVNELDIWVFDASGNKDRCRVTVEIQDPTDACGTSPVVAIRGVAARHFDSEGVADVNFSLYNIATQHGRHETTDAAGAYAFTAVPTGEPYELSPEKDDDPMNGVSTRDLIFIQRHLLGIQDLDSPHKLIAADINRSNHVSAKDLVDLRKMILGLHTEFRSMHPDQRSWRFVAEPHSFTDPTQPFGFPEKWRVDSLARSAQRVDFTAVKVGDVDGTSSANVAAGLVARSGERLVLGLQDLPADAVAGETLSLPVFGSGVHMLSGFQMTLYLDPAVAILDSVKSGLAGLTPAHFAAVPGSPGLYTFSWHAETGAVAPDGDAAGRGAGTAATAAGDAKERAPLFELVLHLRQGGSLRGHVSINSRVTAAEAYDARFDIIPVQLDVLGDNSRAAVCELYQNAPNPFSDFTVIGFDMDESRPVQLFIYDSKGKVVWYRRMDARAGYNAVELSQEELPGVGVYYYQLDAESFTRTRKMVLVR